MLQRLYLAMTLLGTCAFLVAACSDDTADQADDTAEPATTEPEADDTAEPDEQSEEPAEIEPEETVPPIEATVRVEATPYSPIAAAVHIEATGPVKVSITATADDHEVSTPTTAIARTSHVLPLVGMRQDRTYALAVEITDADGVAVDTLDATFTTGTVPFPLPDFELTIDTDRAQPGITLIEFNPQVAPEGDEGGQPVVGIDEEGEVVWWYRNTGSVGAVRPTPWGTLISHYFPVGIREFDILGNVVGNWQVSPEPPENPVEIRDADALAGIAALFGGNEGDPEALSVKADWVDLTSFHHEAYPMPNGNILAMSTTNHEITPEQRETFCPGDDVPFAITSDVIVEFEPDGTVVRTWDLWDVLDIDEIPGVHLCNTDGLFESVDFRDWTHANSVVYDEARDAILISSRHTNQVIALDHLDSSGPQASVRWILGENGTIPLDGDPPYHQHAVEVEDDGSIVLYDNGNFRPGTTPGDPNNPTYSRAVHYAINDSSDDPADWSATQIWEHVVDDVDGQPVYAFFIGDADQMDNGNIFIIHGGIAPQDGFRHARLIEVDPEGADGGDIVWDLTIGTADAGVTVYRAERLSSLYFGPDWES